MSDQVVVVYIHDGILNICNKEQNHGILCNIDRTRVYYAEWSKWEWKGQIQSDHSDTMGVETKVQRQNNGNFKLGVMKWMDRTLGGVLKV